MPHHTCVYMGTIPGGVQCGTSVTLEGNVSCFTERFDIDLTSSLGDSDIPLHSSFRFNEGCIVRNHRKNGCAWGCEERGGAMPLRPGQDFVIQFTVLSNAIEMSVNGCHFSSFSHRLPMCSISCVAVYGGVRISGIKFS